MKTWQAGDVETNGITLHYTRTGGNKAALVLAHGVTDNGLCWTPVAQALASDYDVIMVDARGHGLSEAPVDGYDPRTQADDLRGLIVALGLHKPLVMGHSMGAVTTLVMAALYPELPGAIVLEDPPGWWANTPSPIETDDPEQAGARASAVIHGRTNTENEMVMGIRAWFNSLKLKTREQLIAEQRSAAPSWSEAELEPWAESKKQVSEHVFSVFSPNGPQGIAWSSLLRAVSCPALLITADSERGAVLPADAAQALKALIPQLRIVHIPGAGHNIRREQFVAFMAAVEPFLAASQI